MVALLQAISRIYDWQFLVEIVLGALLGALAGLIIQALGGAAGWWALLACAGATGAAFWHLARIIVIPAAPDAENEDQPDSRAQP